MLKSSNKNSRPGTFFINVIIGAVVPNAPSAGNVAEVHQKAVESHKNHIEIMKKTDDQLSEVKFIQKQM